LTADSADLNSEEREQMAVLKAKVASLRRGITHTGWRIVIAPALDTMIRCIDSATRGVAHRLVGQGFELNQAQLCVIPVSSKATSRTRRRTS
jgi:hypothetical protein